MVWVALRIMGRPRKATREGSVVEGAKEVEQAERLNHDITCNALHAKSDNRSMISGWKLE